MAPDRYVGLLRIEEERYSFVALRGEKEVRGKREGERGSLRFS